MNKNSFICDLSSCRLYLSQMPIILPCCGSTICGEHQDNIEINDGKYKCPICNEQELYLKNGFPINKKIMNLINNGDHLDEQKDHEFNKQWRSFG